MSNHVPFVDSVDHELGISVIRLEYPLCGRLEFEVREDW